ncbi:uncharacterized protein TRAVEDRAFT_51914 [Trametes versicolor FP-101664 SS1]|uniref:uncharacterized protein n=1 Tax=Trametes versicolor (strain FP-101664) TaxID=717944 RepID=UPI00046232F8|nr:uncharacterized protein TRAVEDRAFT_51914 [Trametes versicolor FP-101664 SS1]EIW54194.1 hypothetical protein TRAVEDRAFT_51914 [Trametes versicolor FP-101664 SS1]
MSNSSKAAQRNREEKLPDVGKLNPGYVCCVHETLATVAELIFKDSPGVKEDPDLLQKCIDQLKRIYHPVDPNNRMGKKRPCIFLFAAENNQNADRAILNGAIICVMGTFGGETPPDEWIIAFSYYSPSPLLGTWRIPKDARSSGKSGQSSTFIPGARYHGETAPHYWLDKETRRWLKKQCEERLKTWAEKCRANPAFARGCVFEYRYNRAKASQKSWASHVSLNSAKTCASRAARLGTPLGTVPETDKFSVTSPHRSGKPSSCHSRAHSLKSVQSAKGKSRGARESLKSVRRQISNLALPMLS